MLLKTLNTKILCKRKKKKPDKKEGDCSVAQVGKENQAWLALSLDTGCWGLCPVEFWNLPTASKCTTSVGKLHHCFHVRKCLLVQGWNILSFNLWPLLLLTCTIEEPLGLSWWSLRAYWQANDGSFLRSPLPLAEPALLPWAFLSRQVLQPLSVLGSYAQLLGATMLDSVYQHLIWPNEWQKWDKSLISVWGRFSSRYLARSTVSNQNKSALWDLGFSCCIWKKWRNFYCVMLLPSSVTINEV